ncbi:MAG: penicillin-binding protein 2 [Lachnospiraceae bacterium]|nr:penicillin-binding protein 2 [Lachnospiraceae bacterium]
MSLFRKKNMKTTEDMIDTMDSPVSLNSTTNNENLVIYETEKDERSHKKKKRANRQIMHITFFFVLVFLGLIAYMIKFTYLDSPAIIVNSRNKRQASFAQKTIRGKIYSSDGKVLAQTEDGGTDSEHRVYPYGREFAHVVGYNKKGMSGLESKYNYQLLTSNSGLGTQIKNALLDHNNEGDSLYTTLNTRVQEAAYDALGNRKGAVLAIEPSTGKILAMVSKPDFNPNAIEDSWEELNTSTGSSLVNRATQGLYPPGSTFKIITAIEYMRDHKNYEDFSYTCNSTITKNSVKVSCYHGSTHGKVNLRQAIAKSCNTAFVELGSDLSKSKLRKLAENFLLNQDTGVDIANKKSSMKLSAKTQNSQMPQTVIGQGDTLMTPLNNALIMCAIANDGIIMKPYLAERIESAGGNIIKEYSSTEYQEAISKKEAATMKEMLQEVIENGTGSRLKNSRYSVAGKTGSAEYNSNKDSHAWFVGMSNVENPDLVVCVIVEGGGAGGSTAAPVAKQVFDAYYDAGLGSIE